MSLASENYESEILPYRVVRNWETLQYVGMEIAAPREHLYDEFFVTAMPIDMFNSFTFEKCSFEIHSEEGNVLFYPKESDNNWVAVPITQDQLKDESTVAYIASFMDTSLHAGRVNHVFRGRYTDTAQEYAAKTMAMRLMSCCNSISIPGPKKAILVLVDCTATSHPEDLQFGHNLLVPVFVDIRNVQGAEFGGAWNDWYSNENIANIADDARRALNVILFFY